MSHGQTPSAPVPHDTPRSSANLRLRVTLALIFAAALLYVARYALRYFRSNDASVASVTIPFAVTRLVHISFGIAAILVGPLQLFSGPTRRHLRFHRLLGRVYVTAVFTGSAASGIMLSIAERSLDYRLGLPSLALVWFGTTAFAWVAIRRGHVRQHQEWMIRSYVTTYAFVIFRVIYEVFRARQVASLGEILAIASWACWSIPLLLTEFVLQGRKVVAAERNRSRTAPASGRSRPRPPGIRRPMLR